MFVGRGVAVSIGVGLRAEVVKVAATVASTVASIAVSASRVPRIPASSVAGTSAVGRDAVCVSAGDGTSLVQATAVRPEITKTIRMIILIFLPQFHGNFQSSLSTGSAAPGADRGELPGQRPDQDAPLSPAASSPFSSARWSQSDPRRRVFFKCAFHLGLGLVGSSPPQSNSSTGTHSANIPINRKSRECVRMFLLKIGLPPKDPSPAPGRPPRIRRTWRESAAYCRRQGSSNSQGVKLAVRLSQRVVKVSKESQQGRKTAMNICIGDL